MGKEAESLPRGQRIFPGCGHFVASYDTHEGCAPCGAEVGQTCSYGTNWDAATWSKWVKSGIVPASGAEECLSRGMSCWTLDLSAPDVPSRVQGWSGEEYTPVS